MQLIINKTMPLFPSHPDWGFTDSQRRALYAMTQLPNFQQLVDFEPGMRNPIGEAGGKRKAHGFHQIVITKDGVYHSFILPCRGQPQHTHSTSHT